MEVDLSTGISLSLGLTAVAPHLVPADVAAWAAALGTAFPSAGITTPRRIAAFLGQVAVESAGFLRIEEDLHYTAERLLEVFPNRFNAASAAACAGRPIQTAEAIYGGRLGNGPCGCGDGYMFRGRGLIQITGRANYHTWGGAGTPVSTAEIVAATASTKAGAVASAIWFWSSKRLNPLADAWSVSSISRIINGGSNGLAERIQLSNAALRALS